MNPFVMLKVRHRLHWEYKETLDSCIDLPPEDGDDDFGWPYESFFRFEYDWSRQPVARELTWVQWLHVMVGDSVDDYVDDPNEEWEMSVHWSGDDAAVYTSFDCVLPEAEFDPDEFWSLERWCWACDVKLTDAEAALTRCPELAI